MGNITKEIGRNTKIINELHSRIHETVKYRNESNQKNKGWKQACEEFHHQYDALAFPGGLEGAYERIVNGDKYAMEAAICFLECRPYFFRSGYMFKDILRKVKRAPLSNKLQTRLQKILEAYNEYKKSKRA
ncbi:hypothetical protein MNBD_GAMMA11-1416 [hydrothermal vent metagenome]|uniref:Uncharacterized protein n=1 Tax=hydrothermal vent metagenome TaxID=652676 RepID=A0A3B0XSG1_9ZZZZ